MGSIPVRSTKKHRMQFCIRCFLVFFLVNCPRFVNMACHILAEGLPLAGNGKFPYIILAQAIIAKLHSVFFGTPSRESVLGSSIRQSRILAEGLPLAGNGKFPSKEKLVVIFSRYCPTRKPPFLAYRE